MSDGELAKVLFRVEEEDGTARVETLWAAALGDDRYRLDNSPFYAYGVSWNDIVHAPFREEEGLPTFDRVMRKSGHRTVRVIFEDEVRPGSRSRDLLDRMVAMGCSFEGAQRTYISVDIPPAVDLHAVRDFLIAHDLRFEHADPTYEALFPEAQT